VVTLIERCLERDHRQRLRDIGEARIALEGSRQPAARASTQGDSSDLRRRLRVAAGLLAGLVVGATAIWEWERATTRTAAPVHLAMRLAPAERLTGDAYQRPMFRGFDISRDGRVVVFAGTLGDQTLIYRRALSDATATAVPGTEGGRFPFLSPDGRWIGYFVADTLRKVSIEGGTSVPLCSTAMQQHAGGATESGLAVTGATWDGEDAIVFGSYSGRLWRVPSAGGRPTALTVLDSSTKEYYQLPHSLPDARGVLFTAIANPEGTPGRVLVLPQGEREARLLMENAADARYAVGRLLFMRNATVFAAPFDLKSLRVTGPEVPVQEGVVQSLYDDNVGNNSAAGQFAVSETGTLVYGAGGTIPPQMNRLLWLDRSGKEDQIGERGPNVIGGRLSADGKLIAWSLVFHVAEPIRIYDLESKRFFGLTGVTGEAVFPVWAPDNRHLAFSWFKDGYTNIWFTPIDGSAAPRRLTAASRTQIPADITRDGRLLAYMEVADSGPDIWVVPLDASGPPRVAVQTPGVHVQPAFSPNGHWLAYVSSVSRSDAEVYVKAFPGPGPERQVSSGGGLAPVWSGDGRRLWYDAHGTLMEVGIESSPTLRIGASRSIGPDHRLLTSYPTRSFDVTPDGKRFLINTYEPRPNQPITTLDVVLNWLSGPKTAPQ
jgi:serine/threonine-protein kinase